MNRLNQDKNISMKKLYSDLKLMLQYVHEFYFSTSEFSNIFNFFSYSHFHFLYEINSKVQSIPPQKKILPYVSHMF